VASKNVATIARWLRPFVFPLDITAAPRPTALEVYHVNVNDAAAPIHRYGLAEIDEQGLANLARDVDEQLGTDADGLTGTQRYMLFCVTGDDDNPKRLGRLPLRYRGQPEDGDADEISSEPATAKGLLAQSQRHTEAFARLAIGQMAPLAGVQERMISRLADMNDKMMDKHVELLELVEELSSHKHARQLEEKREEGKQATRAIFAKQLMPMIATIVRKATGATPAGALPPEVAQIKTLLESLTDQQQEQLQAILSPAQVIAFVDLFDQMDAKEEKAATNSH